MPGACEEHKSKKKGACSFCNVCRCCEPLESCLNKINHIHWKRNAIKAGTYVAPQVTKREPSKRVKRKRIELLTETDDENEVVEVEVTKNPIEPHSETDDENEVVEVTNPKTKLTKVCEALDIDAKVLRFPANGFTIESLEKNGTAKMRAKSIVRTIGKGVCDQVCPGNPHFRLQMIKPPADKLDPKFDKLLSKASELIYFGNKRTRNIVKSLLSTALDKNFLRQRLASECEKYVGTEHETMVKKKSVLGKVHFATTRKWFQCLRQGEDIPKQKYKSRTRNNGKEEISSSESSFCDITQMVSLSTTGRGHTETKIQE